MGRSRGEKPTARRFKPACRGRVFVLRRGASQPAWRAVRGKPGAFVHSPRCHIAVPCAAWAVSGFFFRGWLVLCAAFADSTTPTGQAHKEAGCERRDGGACAGRGRSKKTALRQRWPPRSAFGLAPVLLARPARPALACGPAHSLTLTFAGIVGKYATRYGASLRKIAKKIEITQHATYTCAFCGKQSVKRRAVGIWDCKGCGKSLAGGAWVMTTTAAATVRSTVRRLRDLNERK